MTSSIFLSDLTYSNVLRYYLIKVGILTFRMIQSFGDEETEVLFMGGRVKRFEKFERVARRKLEMLNAALTISDLKVPPGNKLEQLKGKRSRWHSIRINDQWRACFIWTDGHAENVQIEDYH